MSNLSYWERRQIEDIYQQIESAEDCADEISKLYRKASRYLSLQADAIFERFQTKHNLTDQEARRLLNAMQDRTSLDEMLNKLKNTSSSQEKAELIKKLEAPAYQARLERLRQLQNQIDYVMKNVYQQEKDFSTSHYIDLANEAYYRSIYRLQQRAGAAFSFGHVSAKQIDKVVGSRWSGRNYSERIWKNTRALAKDLKEELLINLVTGRTNREVAEIIANKFGQGSFNARRLVRTESNFVATQMNFEAYEDAGIEEYQYLATLDLRTSQVCRELDGQIFSVKDRKTGTNCPPMHPWCRSTTISVVNREWIEDMQRSALDPATGKKIKVPRSMNYQQWYDIYVKGKPEEGNNAVAKSVDSGIIKPQGYKTMSIGSPIEQRNTGKGSPNAILHFDRPLNNRQQRILDALTEKDSRVIVSKKDIKLSDLAALTAKTGDEFALFTKKGERMIVRGDSFQVLIDENNAAKMAHDGWKWSGHTHPGSGINVKTASPGDYAVLKAFGQKYSVILDSTGAFDVFRGD